MIRLNADGSIDNSFDPVATNVTYAPYIGTSTTGADGKIYAGGQFNQVEGVSTVKVVAFEGEYNAAATGSIRWVHSAPGSYEFAGTTYLAVARSGGRNGAASVSFASSYGTAGAADFTASTGTLTWADGEAGTQYIPIALTDDSDAEGDETFTVTLSSVTGASLSGSAAVTVTIRDDEVAPTIVSDPISIAVREGEDASFSVLSTVRWHRATSGVRMGSISPVQNRPATRCPLRRPLMKRITLWW